MVLPVWRQYLAHQCEYLQNHAPIFQANRSGNKKVAVIVEPRRHAMLEPVVRNVMYHLGPGWNLEIVTHHRNIDFIERSFGGCTLRITPIPYTNMNQTLYNHLLLDPWFWWHLREEHVFVFQTDCILFRRGIDDWLDYDYVGANYFHPDHMSPVCGGIQGGLSLRKRSVMLECLDKVSWRTIQYHRTHHGCEPLECFHEDIYFTHACEILEKELPDVANRKCFSIEAEYWDRPFGHHGTTKAYFTREQMDGIISQCEDRAMWSLP